MATKAELVKTADNELNCSVCRDFKVEIVSYTKAFGGRGGRARVDLVVHWQF